MSRDYGWTLREILELTPGEVLIYVDRQRSAARVLVSTREARVVATGARERRAAWIEREMRASGDPVERVEPGGDWERLVGWSERIGEERPDESDAASNDKRSFDLPTMRDGERLRLILEELRLIRAVLASDKRAWRE